MNEEHDLVEEYLDRLAEELSGRRELRRTLAEVEDHLREAAAAVATGTSEAEAQQVAIERFGDPGLVARRLEGRVDLSGPAGPAMAALRIAGICLTAIGLDGVIIAVFALLFGSTFAIGSWAYPLPAAYCADLLNQHPAANTCAAAEQLDKLGNEILWRLIPGAVGLLLLGGLRLASRRWPDGRFRLLTTPVASLVVCGSLLVAGSFWFAPADSQGVRLAGIFTCVTVGGLCLGHVVRRSHRVSSAVLRGPRQRTLR